MKTNVKIRYVQYADKDFWFTLDKHLSVAEFEKKVRDKQGYIIMQNDLPFGILRYNLFWDNIPFCTLLYIEENHQRNGFGRMFMEHWENEMQSFGFDLALVSTQADESAQIFYRSIGYSDCGTLIVPNQPVELFLRKRLSSR